MHLALEPLNAVGPGGDKGLLTGTGVIRLLADVAKAEPRG